MPGKGLEKRVPFYISHKVAKLASGGGVLKSLNSWVGETDMKIDCQDALVRRKGGVCTCPRGLAEERAHSSAPSLLFPNFQ